jgi:hypothetical protein
MFIYSPYNSTTTNTSLVSAILIYGVYLVSFIVVLTVSIVIIHITMKNAKMRTISNMLICNTCIISLLHSITTFLQIFMVVFNSHHRYGDSRIFCIVRAYLETVTSTLLSMSFLLQALSRLFYSVYYNHRNCLLTFKCHYYLLAIQWLIGFLIPLSILIRNDHVVYRPVNFCTIDIENTLHLAYLYTSAYLVPTVFIILIYITIVYRVNDSKNNARNTQSKRNNARGREASLLKNIVILVAIFTFGGLPSVVYVSMMAPRRILSIHFFIFSLLTVPLAIAMEKITVLCLNSDFRTAFIQCCCRVARNKVKKKQRSGQKKKITAFQLEEDGCNLVRAKGTGAATLEYLVTR